MKQCASLERLAIDVHDVMSVFQSERKRLKMSERQHKRGPQELLKRVVLSRESDHVCVDYLCTLSFFKEPLISHE